MHSLKRTLNIGKENHQNQAMCQCIKIQRNDAVIFAISLDDFYRTSLRSMVVSSTCMVWWPLKCHTYSLTCTLFKTLKENIIYCISTYLKKLKMIPIWDTVTVSNLNTSVIHTRIPFHSWYKLYSPIVVTVTVTHSLEKRKILSPKKYFVKSTL